MPPSENERVADFWLKTGILGVVVLIDALWMWVAHFTFEMVSLGSVAIVIASLLVVGAIYRQVPNKSHLVTMTTETAWLVAFCAAGALLSNLVITLNMPLVDDELAAADRMVRFDWLRWFDFVCSSRLHGFIFSIAYISALPETVLVIVMLAASGRPGRIREMMLASMIGGVLAIVISAAFPSAGALAYFQPDQTELVSHPVVTLAYKATFFDLRA